VGVDGGGRFFWLNWGDFCGDDGRAVEHLVVGLHVLHCEKCVCEAGAFEGVGLWIFFHYYTASNVTF
jgi:hypothetical protein